MTCMNSEWLDRGLLVGGAGVTIDMGCQDEPPGLEGETVDGETTRVMNHKDASLGPGQGGRTRTRRWSGAAIEWPTPVQSRQKVCGRGNQRPAHMFAPSCSCNDELAMLAGYCEAKKEGQCQISTADVGGLARLVVPPVNNESGEPPTAADSLGGRSGGQRDGT